MFLDRLRIGSKLVLLAIIPLIAVLALAVPVIVGRVNVANKAANTSRSIATAGQVASVVRELQAERLLTIGFRANNFASRSDVLVQEAVVDDKLAVLRSRVKDEKSTALYAAVKAFDQLPALRSQSLANNIAVNTMSDQLTALIDGLINGTELFRSADSTTPIGRQVLAMDAALRVGEANSLNLATLTQLLATPNGTLLSRYVSGLNTYQEYTNRYFEYANGSQAALYHLVQEAITARGSEQLDTLGEKSDLSAVKGLSLSVYFPRFTSFLGQNRYIETKLVADIGQAADDQQRTALIAAYSIGAGLVLVLFLVAGLTVLVGRRVSQPLVALASSANRIATAVESELTRVADDESEVFEPVRLEAVNISGRDEIGELTRAFDQVQSTATRLVERQVTSRRNVATMFGHIGRRTQNLIGRQLVMIDRLERQETSPDRLGNLYQLDHLSSRLNRNAGSLVVLSGSMATEAGGGPMPLGDVVRLALGEIEDYTRVDVEVPEHLVVQPSVGSDLTLIFAELMENATAYSPPQAKVTVTAEATRAGAQILIVDRGIGMTAERLAIENARLARRERLDLAPTEVLGLFVTGRLARRHGIGVTLAPTPGGGITAVIALTEQHLLSSVYQGVAAVESVQRTLPPSYPGSAQQSDVLRVPNTAETVAPGQSGGDLAEAVGASTAFDQIALRRATKAISAGLSWDAFATPADPESAAANATPPAVAHNGWAEPAPMVDPDPSQSWWDRPSAAPTAPALPTAPPPVRAAPQTPVPAQRSLGTTPQPPTIGSSNSPADKLRSGLQRRVPGAQLPPRPAAAGRRFADQTAEAADPAAARALVEEFEAGVRNAQRQSDTGSVPRLPQPGAGSGVPAMSAPAPAPVRMAQPQPTPVASAPAGRSRPVGTTFGMPSGTTFAAPAPATVGASTTTAMPTSAPAPSRQERNGLVRRVPGATLGNLVSSRSSSSVAATPADPDAARALIEQIESGVSRALNDVVIGDYRHEGSPR